MSTSATTVSRLASIVDDAGGAMDAFLGRVGGRSTQVCTQCFDTSVDVKRVTVGGKSGRSELETNLRNRIGLHYLGYLARCVRHPHDGFDKGGHFTLAGRLTQVDTIRLCIISGLKTATIGL